MHHLAPRLTPLSLVLLLAACGQSPKPSLPNTPHVGGAHALSLNSGQVYELHNACSSQVLDVNAISKDDGARVQVYTDWHGANQQWQVQTLADGSSQFTSVNSGKVLDVEGWSRRAGATVAQYPANGGANQHWRVTDLGNGLVKLNPMHAPNLALAVRNGATGDAAPVQLETDAGGCAQQWQLTAALAPTPAQGVRLFGIYTGTSDWNPSGEEHTDNWWRDFQAAEQAIGHPINALTHFPSWGPRDWWAYHLKTTVAESLAKRPGLVPLVGLKLISNREKSDGADDVGWMDSAEMAQVAAGARDNVWTGVVDALADLKVPLSVIRLGYEDNNDFMQDAYGDNDPERMRNWTKAMTHAFTVMRAEARARGITVLLAVCPLINNSQKPVESELPDPATYDILGADFYNAYWGQGDVNDVATREAYWASPGGWGLDQHIALAKKLGKGVMFFEHGSNQSSDGPEHGLANDAAFWDYSAARITQMRQQGVPYYGSALWDIPAGDANARFSGGEQPEVLNAVRRNSAALVGDDLSSLIEAANR